MARLKIENVGPIKKGYDAEDGFMDFRGVTLFIGNQGSGKSTVAKLFSTLSWIEKALVRGDFTENFLSQYSRFRKHLAYQNISNYLNPNSLIEYEGAAYQIRYEAGQVNVRKQEEAKAAHYSFPKVMYMPAERNFVSAVERPDLWRRLPLPLYSFLVEYEDAKQHLAEKVALPVDGLGFEYMKGHKKSFLVGQDYRIELLEASSGYQSLVPLVLVTRYLTQLIKNQVVENKKEISREDEEKIRKAIDALMEKEDFSEDVLKALLERLSGRLKYDSLVNIVEEPECNLYPSSQRAVLFELLEHYNENRDNQLIITTHSPYILGFLNIAIQAEHLGKAIAGDSNGAELENELSQIVPLKSLVRGEAVCVYQMDEASGTIKKLPAVDGIPSNKNFLNDMLRQGNQWFDQLLEIEEKIQP